MHTHSLRPHIAMIEDHEITRHPFVERFRAGQLTKEQFVFFLRQQSFFSTSLPDCFAMLFARVPYHHWARKRKLIDLLTIEAWGSNEQHAHSLAFCEVTEHVGLDAHSIRPEDETHYTRTYLATRLRACSERPVTAGLAVIALANEVLNLTLFRAYREGIHKIAGLEACPTGYFDAHLRDEGEDFAVFDELFCTLITESDEVTAAMRAVEHVLKQRITFFTHLLNDLDRLT